MAVVEITNGDPELQHAFCEYVPTIDMFADLDFHRWRARGEWTEHYRAFAVVEHDVVVASVSVATMSLVVEGCELVGYQLGAVGCRYDRRRTGLAAQAMDAALQFCGTAPMMLFANPTVLDFYPRFGFEAAAQHAFSAEHVAAPTGARAGMIDPSGAEGRAALHAAAGRALASTSRFGAVRYDDIIAWYVDNDLARPLRVLDNGALVFAAVEQGTLFIDDVLSETQFDLLPEVPRLIDEPVTRVEFGFSPEQWWHGPVGPRVDDDSHLFLRNFPSTPADPSQFPLLAHT